MDIRVNHIVEELQKQLTPIEVEEKRIRDELGQLKIQRQKINAALKVLDESSPKPKPAKRGKPCLTNVEADKIITEILNENGLMEQDDVFDLAKERIVEEGTHSLSGFALRFQKLITEPKYHIHPDGKVSLIQDA